MGKQMFLGNILKQTIFPAHILQQELGKDLSNLLRTVFDT